MKAIESKSAVTDVISHDVAPLAVNTDFRKFSRMGWFVVLFGVVGFLIWAVFAPLDKGVPMSGTVSTEGNRKAVQHQFGGTIEEILVKDGSVVKQGQVLVRINQTSAKSAAETSRSQYFAALAMEARLKAERDGLSTITMPSELDKVKDDPRVVENMALQRQLLSSRQSSLHNELSAYDENIAGVKAQARGIEESRESKKVQLAIIKEQLDSMRDLAKDGFIARNRLLDVERTYAQINGAISEDLGNLGRAQRQILEVGLRRIQRTQDYQKEVRAQLGDTQKEVNALQSRMTGLDYELANTEVKAPVDGVVVGLAVFTKGGVVPPGFRMMDVVPTDDALVVEGQLAVNLIDKVHTGMPAELIFSAFNAAKTPHIPGTVIQVSADRTVDEHTGAPYYKIRARVTPEGAKLIASHKLEVRSGMPVELFVKTGERSMMSYLMKPIFDRAKTSLSEE